MKCSRAQWADPEFRREYYRKNREEIKEKNLQRYYNTKDGRKFGVFAVEPSYYRHNGHPVRWR